MSESSSTFSISGSGDNGRNKDLCGAFFAISVIGVSSSLGGAFNSGKSTWDCYLDLVKIVSLYK